MRSYKLLVPNALEKITLKKIHWLYIEELSSDVEEGDSEGGAKEDFEETGGLDLFVKDTC